MTKTKTQADKQREQTDELFDKYRVMIKDDKVEYSGLVLWLICDLKIQLEEIKKDVRFNTWAIQMIANQTDHVRKRI